MSESQLSPADALSPRTLRVETAHYIIRTLETADATEAFGSWLMDPTAQRQLNAAPRMLTLAEVRAHIASFDRVNAHLLGIFEKANGRLVGIRAVMVNHALKEFLINVLIGEADARAKGARLESRFGVYNFMFEELGMVAARCSIVEDNAGMVRSVEARGWVLIDYSRKAKASGEGFVMLRNYRMTREAWRAGHGAKAFAEQQG